ncbi:MAG: flagellar motor protein MotB [Cellvibrionaceae bacterium]|nr:flagellar motor protein MotB [Cellvibrionaceae bacterium]
MSDEDEESACDCVPGLPPWMGTFADLMSLLMCFFVLLLSFSEMDAMKFKRLAGSMAQAFGVQNKLNVVDVPKGTSIIAQEFSPGIPSPTPINEIWQKTDDVTEMSLEVQCNQEYDIEAGDEAQEAGVKSRVRAQLEALIKETQQDAQQLAEALTEEIASGEIEVETEGRKIIIRIREKGSFKSGSHELSDRYYDVMDEIRGVLLQKPGKIQVQGHTDNIPIRSARYRSNWELSAARAVTVAEALMKSGDINPRRFEVSGLADTQPLVDNSTKANRIRNRRVEIVVRQGLGEDLSEEEKTLLQEEGQDVMRDLDLDPDYLFNLAPEEIF